jgi:hypothetical protein
MFTLSSGSFPTRAGASQEIDAWSVPLAEIRHVTFLGVEIFDFHVESTGVGFFS